jgi:hypothetical protein
MSRVGGAWDAVTLRSGSNKYLPMSRSQVAVGPCPLSLRAPPDRSALVDEFKRPSDGGQRRGLETSVVSRDRSRLSIAWKARYLPDRDDGPAIFAVGHDITFQNRLKTVRCNRSDWGNRADGRRPGARKPQCASVFSGLP